MYRAAGVSGPTAFGELPLSDQLFWQGWLNEKLQRESDHVEGIESQFDN